jgi:hypothetical protein
LPGKKFTEKKETGIEVLERYGVGQVLSQWT